MLCGSDADIYEFGKKKRQSIIIMKTHYQYVYGMYYTVLLHYNIFRKIDDMLTMSL